MVSSFQGYLKNSGMDFVNIRQYVRIFSNFIIINTLAMKIIKRLFILVLMHGTHTFALTTGEQLKSLNSYWAYHGLNDGSEAEQRVFASDAELIRLHLQLVERSLRAGSAKTFSQEQWKQRLDLLDVLHAYWTAGIFPKNTGHLLRAPYFIDFQGTACAVGQLIICSGNAALANTISQEHNNGYISELALRYPQIQKWADAHGFALEELAWIQPCYAAPQESVDLRNPTCHNANNGYFFPDLSQIQGPGVLTKSFYKWQSNTWTPWQNICGQWLFDYLQSGKYKWEVADGANAVYTFTAELVAPPPATVTLIPSGNFSTCNGTITALAQGGVAPFKYNWNGTVVGTSVLTGVCEQSLTLYFYESGGWCSQTVQIETGAVSIKEVTLNKLYISPNPVRDVMQLNLDPAIRPDKEIAKIVNVQGQVVLEAELSRDISRIDLHQLPPGLYFLRLDHYRVQRFIKE